MTNFLGKVMRNLSGEMELNQSVKMIRNYINRFDAVSAYMRKMDHYGLSDFLKINHIR